MKQLSEISDWTRVNWTILFLILTGNTTNKTLMLYFIGQILVSNKADKRCPEQQDELIDILCSNFRIKSHSPPQLLKFLACIQKIIKIDLQFWKGQPRKMSQWSCLESKKYIIFNINKNNDICFWNSTNSKSKWFSFWIFFQWILGKVLD